MLNTDHFEDYLHELEKALAPNAASPPTNLVDAGASPKPIVPLWLPVSEVARQLQVTEATIRNQVRRDPLAERIPWCKVGRLIRIHRSYIEERPRRA